MGITINPRTGEVMIDAAYGLITVRFDTKNIESTVRFVAGHGMFVCSLDDTGTLEVQFLPNQPGEISTLVIPRMAREPHQAWSMSFYPVACDPEALPRGICRPGRSRGARDWATPLAIFF